MSATEKKAPSKSKSAAAREEVEPQPKTVKWRGLELTLPGSLPSTFLFDLELIRGNNDGAVMALLRSLVGTEQFVEIRDQVRPDDNVVELVDGLLDDVLGAYGSAAGESSASQDS